MFSKLPMQLSIYHYTIFHTKPMSNHFNNISLKPTQPQHISQLYYLLRMNINCVILIVFIYNMNVQSRSLILSY